MHWKARITLSPSGIGLLDSYTYLVSMACHLYKQRAQLLCYIMTEKILKRVKTIHVEFTDLSFETISSSEIGIEGSKVRYLQKEYGRHLLLLFYQLLLFAIKFVYH